MRDYRLIRSRRKTLSISVEEDLSVVVRAPNALPQDRIDRFVARHEEWICAHVQLQAERNAEREVISISAAEQKRLREQARTELGSLLELYGERMGVRCTRLTITGAQTRWGSCSGKNAVSFSWRLMLAPAACREYVVVHELAHILEHNHSPAFYANVRRIMPDYQEREKYLSRFAREHRIVEEE